MTVYVCMCTCMCPRRPEEGTRAGVICPCEPSCGCWELNLSPLKKEQVLSTAELFFQVLS